MTTTILSESSVAVTLGDTIDLEIHHKALAFCDWLSDNPFPGLISVVLAYASVTVFFDPVLVKNNWPEQPSPARAVQAFLEKQIARFSNKPVRPSRPGGQIPDSTNPQLVQIPVRYDGADLAEVSDRLHLSENEVIKLHTEAIYTVFMIGFLPGFPYLGPLPETLELPRRDTPRLCVPAGSVAIAGRQTGIYPQVSPGGWHLIGRTDFRLFDPTQTPPARLQPGMQVQFKRIA